MNKKTFFDTTTDPEYDQENGLSADLTEDTPHDIQQKAESHEFINSILYWISSIIVWGIALYLLFKKDTIIEKPFIEIGQIIRLSASQLSFSIVLFLVGTGILLIGRYRIKIKK